MDMPGMNMDPEVVDLPLTDPRCIKAQAGCLAFAAATNESQAAVPWASLFDYGHYATYYWVIIVGVLAVIRICVLITDRSRRSLYPSSTKPSLFRKIQATGRFIFYRRSPVLGYLMVPTFGTLAFVLLAFAFFCGLVFAGKPYYRAQLGYGSPPIAIRSGLMATACTPILVALAGKANIITLLSGISHEKLNVIHRWVAWLSFVLSLIHGLPFFIASYRDPSDGGYARVKKEFYFGVPYGCNQYSGVPPLAILFTLCILSLPTLRTRFYESFYAAHILLAITYLGLLFWHSANTLDSWTYLWATLAVWLASWVARAFWFTRPLHVRAAAAGTWAAGSPAVVTALPGADVVRIETWLGGGGDFSWTPGQHAFLRFPAVAPLDNHPFTIASSSSSLLELPSDDAEPDSAEERSVSAGRRLTFLVRAHDGVTRKLLSFARSRSSAVDDDGRSRRTSVWVDGPYGGLSRPGVADRFDTLLLVAGGTGISACLPWLLHVVALRRQQPPMKQMRVRRVILVWAVRKADAVDWVGDSLKNGFACGERGLEVEIKLHVTGETSRDIEWGSEEKTVDNVNVVELDRSTNGWTEGAVWQSGRPAMPNVLNSIRAGEKAMVIGCGPEAFRIDLANTVAGAQRRVISGEVAEISMHLETFGW